MVELFYYFNSVDCFREDTFCSLPNACHESKQINYNYLSSYVCQRKQKSSVMASTR